MFTIIAIIVGILCNKWWAFVQVSTQFIGCIKALDFGLSSRYMLIFHFPFSICVGWKKSMALRLVHFIQSHNQTKHTTAQLDQLAPLNQPRVNDFCFVNQTEKMETNRLSRFTHFAYKLLFNDKIGRNKRAVGYFSFGTWSQNHRNIWLCVEYLECMMCHSCLLFRIR